MRVDTLTISLIGFVIIYTGLITTSVMLTRRKRSSKQYIIVDKKPKMVTISIPGDVTLYIPRILAIEGGYVNDPADRGGPTKYGITLATLQKYLNRRVTAADVQKVTVELATSIYEMEYFTLPHVYLLPDQVQLITLDMNINHGCVRGVQILQTALNNFIPNSVTVDGSIGPETVRVASSILSKFGVDATVNRICDARAIFYQLIVKNNPSQMRFYKGWIARCDSFRLPPKIGIEEVIKISLSERSGKDLLTFSVIEQSGTGIPTIVEDSDASTS